jgi:hypothetical protein
MGKSSTNKDTFCLISYYLSRGFMASVETEELVVQYLSGRIASAAQE